MNLCYEITTVPIHRDSNPIPLSPAAALAARLKPGQTLRFRLHRDIDRIRCFLSSDAGSELQLALRNLPGCGYILVPAQLPPAGQTGILLGRQFRQRTLLMPDQPPRHVCLPVPLAFDEKRADALMEALYASEAGSGIHFSIRVMEGLSPEAVKWLHRMQAQDPVVNGLLFEHTLYQAVGCLYGSASTQKRLLPEVHYAFPGLCPLTVPSAEVSDSILDLYTSSALPDKLQELAATLLPQELEALTNLRGSAGKRGLPLNRDTLFGMPHAHSQKGHQLLLGVNTQGKPVEMPLGDLSRHVLISAPSGAGKGNMIVNLVLQLHQQGIPFLILESQKQELHHLRKQIPDLQTWQPQNGKFVFNPFALPGNITRKEYHSFLKTMLTEAFDGEGPLESLYEEALNLVYALHGYDDNATASTPGTTPLGLNEFIGTFSQIMDAPNYSARTQSDVKSAGITRLNALFNMDRGVFDSVVTIPPELLLTGNNLLQLNCLTAAARQIFATLLLLQISALFRLRGKTARHRDDIRLVILVDEAHALLQNQSDIQGHPHRFALEYDNLLKTLRSLGVGIVTISQTTEGIPRYITDGCHTKLFLGASPYSGVESYRALLHADDTAMEHLFLLEPGDGIYCTASLPQGIFFHTPFLLKNLNLHEDYPQKNAYLENHPLITLHTFLECSTCPARNFCSQTVKTEARCQSAVLVSQYGDAFRSDRKKAQEALLTDLCGRTDDMALRWCILTQTVRDLNRRHPGTLDMAVLIRQLKDLWK